MSTTLTGYEALSRPFRYVLEYYPDEQPELAALVDELDSATDETRIQEIYNTILTTMADQCLTTPLIYTRQLAIYSDTVASYTFPTDASFTSVQNIHLN